MRRAFLAVALALGLGLVTAGAQAATVGNVAAAVKTTATTSNANLVQEAGWRHRRHWRHRHWRHRHWRHHRRWGWRHHRGWRHHHRRCWWSWGRRHCRW